jgi:hypothetical protein
MGGVGIVDRSNFLSRLRACRGVHLQDLTGAAGVALQQVSVQVGRHRVPFVVAPALVALVLVELVKTVDARGGRRGTERAAKLAYKMHKINKNKPISKEACQQITPCEQMGGA